MVLATEWLDNVPLDIAEVDADGAARMVLVEPSGREALGDPVTGRDAEWIARWWPTTEPGERIEIGWPRDAAWADALSRLTGAALAVDYGHLAASRPAGGTLTGFRRGREVPPVPDGSCDLTAHVAIDSLQSTSVLRQREALATRGVHGARPPRELAESDPADYLAALSQSGAAGELRDPAGLGGHYWVFADSPPRIAG